MNHQWNVKKEKRKKWSGSSTSLYIFIFVKFKQRLVLKYFVLWYSYILWVELLKHPSAAFFNHLFIYIFIYWVNLSKIMKRWFDILTMLYLHCLLPKIKNVHFLLSPSSGWLSLDIEMYVSGLLSVQKKSGIPIRRPQIKWLRKQNFKRGQKIG